MTDESVFAAALAIPRPADRAAYLEKACAGNPALRREVEALLSAHAADNPLDRPPADLAVTGDHDATDAGPPAAEVGDRIGPYRLMEQIGEGGFGLVFVAEQSEPIRRKVALKVLKPGMDTRDVVARFEAERQALALMDHPNIARVLDAGSTPAGRPYFVMELVRGVPITDYSDAQKLAPKDRLALFVQVCQAVQHAHQKGVIHRDIKPSNVLVTMIDGKPVPKVIDFGVAKAVGQSLTEKTVYTRFAQILGTPLYMSPEQAEMSGVDVDTRADVYALGVLLYELLTGTTPFDRDRFRRAAFDEIRRIIREEDPPRPSTRLSSLGPTLTDVSAQRGTDPGKLPGLVRGELDWIVMRCLEKDRNRRYETANGLARDVQRFLEGDSVEACPPTLGYQLRKLYRRNRAVVWVGALVLGLTYAGASGIYFAYRRAVQAEARLGEQRDAAVQSEQRAVEERDKAARATESLRQLAERQRRTLYASEMNLAQAAWESGDARRTLELLRPWIPKPGEEDLRGFEWHYWNRQAHQETRTVRLEGLTPQERAMGVLGGLSRDGRRAAGAVNERNRSQWTLRAWDAISGRELWRSAPVRGAFESCTFSDDGHRLLTWNEVREADVVKAEVRVWEARDGRLIYTSSLLSTISMSLLADGERLIIKLREGKASITNYTPMTGIQILRLSDGKELTRIRLQPEDPAKTLANCLALSPNEKCILLEERGDFKSSGGKTRLRLQEWESGRLIWSQEFGVGEYAREAQFFPGGDRLLVRMFSLKKGDALIVLDARDGHRLSTHWLPELHRVSYFGERTIASTRSRFATVQNSRVLVFALDRPAEADNELSMSFHHESDVAAISLLPEDSRLVTLDQSGIVREWDATPPPRFKQVLGYLYVSRDGSRRFSFTSYVNNGSKGAVRIADAAGREVDGRLPSLPPGHAHGPAASADGMTQAISWHPNKGEGVVIVWDLATGRERCRIPLGPGIWENIAVSPDGSRAALLGSPPEMAGKPRIPQLARIIDLNSGAVVCSSGGQSGSPHFEGIAFDHNGKHVVVTRGSSDSSNDWAIVWYDAATLNETARLPIGSRAGVGGLSPDGRLIAIREHRRPGYLGNQSGWDTLRVFPVPPIFHGENPAPLYEITGSAREFDSMEFSPDGRRLLAGEGRLRLWDSTSGAEILSARERGLSSFAISRRSFSLDGCKIWGGLDEKDRLLVWDATPLDDKVIAP